jgi:hypothetical protein
MRRQAPKAGGIQAGENPIPDNHHGPPPDEFRAKRTCRPDHQQADARVRNATDSRRPTGADDIVR